MSGRGTSTPTPTRPGRGLLERRIRGAWGAPGPLLRSAAAVYGAVSDARNLLWDAGMFRPRAAPVPVISVGGLTAGGSGKTPVTAALARWLADDGLAVAVVTPGEGDELALHRELNPDVPASGGRPRLPFVRAEAEAGAAAVLLDSGFQHRRLHRDLEIVVENVDHAGGRARLPAGPYRERTDAVSRADAVIVATRRPDWPEQAREAAAELALLAPRACQVTVRLRPAGLRAANPAGAAVENPDPAIALAGVMWPEAFFRALRAEGVRAARELALPDHGAISAEVAEELGRAAGRRGIVCTRKDAVRLIPVLPASTPVWWLGEVVEWGEGADRLFSGLRRVARSEDT